MPLSLLGYAPSFFGKFPTVQQLYPLLLALQMWWNHVIWCCFHQKKCKKQKKMQCFWKSFMLYLHNESTLEHNSNCFWKLQFRATTLVFYHFRQLVMWPPSWQPIQWTVIGKTICMLFFFTFWVYQLRFPFWRICRGPDMDPECSAWWYINTKHYHQPSLIFSHVFFIYFYCSYI